MRIGIITSWVDPPFYTGVSYYICGLAHHLPQSNRHEYTLVHFQDNDNKIYERAKEKIFSFPTLLPETIKTELGVRLASHALDVIHIPWQVGFFLPVNCAKVITVHELTPVIFPKIQARFWVILHKYFMPRVLKKVDMVITASESTKRDLMRYMSVPETKIKTIYQGVDTEMYKVLPLSYIESIRLKYELDFPFILYVGNIEPKKNIPTLLKAFSVFSQESKNNYRLVIVGKKLWKYQATLNTVKALNLQDRVIFLGYVPENDLPGIFNAASLFVFPSIYEGFGRPLLEAMMCGVPVITSNSSSMPEVVGDAGIMVDPYDIPALAMAIKQVLTDDRLRTTLIEKGLERAKFFSWQKCAKETVAVYEEAYRKANC